MSKLSKGERLILWAGVALLVVSFIPMWASVSAEAFGVGISEDANAFEGYTFFPLELGLLLAYAALALVIVKMVGPSIGGAQVLLGLCGAAFVLLVIGIFTGPEGSGAAVAGIGIDVDRGFMLYVGVVLAAVMAWGAWQDMQSPAAATPPTPAAPPAA